MTEADFIFNTFFLLFCGCLVMFMAMGFAMLEAGSVRSKSVGVILIKNLGLYSISGIMFFLLGYNLMYLNVDGGYMGTLETWRPDDSAALSGDFSAGYASAAGWFFQMVFVATAASIVSGALAERIKLWPFFFFCVVLTGILYPIVGAWTWGGGWLAEMGFKDFAGSTIVHSVGGWAALTGAILLGARRGFGEEDKPLRGNSLPLVTLGTFVLWFGWFGFNGGSQLAISSTEDAIAVAKILANTNLAAAAGALVPLLYFVTLRRRIDLTYILNGALAGLVAITAEPLMPSMMMSLFIGAVGSAIMIACTILLLKLGIDDVVGAIPVHLASGIWGTLAVVISNPEASLSTQAIGILAVGLFIGTISLLIWAFMKYTIGIRLRWSDEDKGADLSELGVKAYYLEERYH